MGLASLILGIIGLILAFIPGCGMFLAIIPINLGIIFGIIGVITEKGKRGKAIIGLSLSGIAIFVMILSTLFFVILVEGEENRTETTQITTEQKATTRTYQMKEYAKLGDRVIRVTKAEKSEGTETIKPKEGKEFITVSVTIQNTGTDTIAYSPYYFKIKNEQKQLKSISLSGLNEATEIEAGELLPGGTVSGTLTFEQSKEDEELTLICYDDLWESEDTVQIRLKFD